MEISFGSSFGSTVFFLERFFPTWECKTMLLIMLGLMRGHMEAISPQCKWVCSLQRPTTWEKGCQATRIWCSQPQLLAWMSPLCLDVCPLLLCWLPWSRQIWRMPTRSRALKKVCLMMTSLEQRKKVQAQTTCSLGWTWNLCCQWLLLSQLWLVACACSWCKFRCCLVSPPYRRSGFLHLLRWFMALSWGAWRIVPMLILDK